MKIDLDNVTDKYTIRGKVKKLLLYLPYAESEDDDVDNVLEIANISSANFEEAFREELGSKITQIEGFNWATSFHYNGRLFEVSGDAWNNTVIMQSDWAIDKVLRQSIDEALKQASEMIVNLSPEETKSFFTAKAASLLGTEDFVNEWKREHGYEGKVIYPDYAAMLEWGYEKWLAENTQ